MAAVDALRTTRTGLWTPALEALPGPSAQEVAAELDDLGFGSLWLPEAVGREAFAGALAILTATRRMVVGTGIASIYGRGPMAANGAARLLESLAPGRFVLGLGVSHRPAVEGARKTPYLPPVEAMTSYLDDLAAALYFGADPDLPPIVLAALGPKMLGLARDRTAGAHSYLVTPAHTASARTTLGDGPLLVVEQAVVLDQGREEAMRRAHAHLDIYTGLPNYRNSWLRQGFATRTSSGAAPSGWLTRWSSRGTRTPCSSGCESTGRRGRPRVTPGPRREPLPGADARVAGAGAGAGDPLRHGFSSTGPDPQGPRTASGAPGDGEAAPDGRSELRHATGVAGGSTTVSDGLGRLDGFGREHGRVPPGLDVAQPPPGRRHHPGDHEDPDDHEAGRVDVEVRRRT